jgi:hypothetical protein
VIVTPFSACSIVRVHDVSPASGGYAAAHSSESRGGFPCGSHASTFAAASRPTRCSTSSISGQQWPRLEAVRYV